MPAPSLHSVISTLARLALKSFLEGGCEIDCRTRDLPKATVIIPVHNRAELTLACLQSLAVGLNQAAIEIIVVDNNSTDETKQLLESTRGVHILSNDANVGFPKAVNQAAQLASGRFLIILNNDVQVLGRSIDHATGFLETHADTGAVGGKIILLDGALQEAGATIGQDGWPCQCGRGQPPDDPAYAYQRDVDYCSGAFLATRRDLFIRSGGFDECFGLGYFEDADFCARLWQDGWRVVYSPDVEVLHFENATSSSIPNLRQAVCRNHATFCNKHVQWLGTRPRPDWSLLARRTSACGVFNILILETCRPDKLSGFSTLFEIEEIIRRVESVQGFVTLCLIGSAGPLRRQLFSQLPKTVEMAYLDKEELLTDWLASRATFYDLVLTRHASLRASYPLPAYSRTRWAILKRGTIRLLQPSDTMAASVPRAA
jgi:GT2 family glycosyltransferase